MWYSDTILTPVELPKLESVLSNPVCSAALLLLLLLSRFSHVRLSASPQMAAHQAPPSLGFSRQEHWSGLPLPSPMHARMLSRFSCVRLSVTPWTAAHQAPLSTGFSRQEYWSGLTFPSSEAQETSHIQLFGPWPVRLLCPWDFPGENTGVGCHFLSRGSPWPRDQTRLSCVSYTGRWTLTTVPPGKPLTLPCWIHWLYVCSESCAAIFNSLQSIFTRGRVHTKKPLSLLIHTKQLFIC